MDVEGDKEQTSVVEDEVVKITYSAVEEEEDQISGVEMTDTIMETIIGIVTGAAPMTASGVVTTTPANGAIIVTISSPPETSGTYRIPSQQSWI